MTALLNWRVWAAAVAAIFLTAACWKSYHIGKAQVQADWDAEKVEQSRLSIALQNQTAKTTAELQTNTDNRNEVLHAQVNRITADRNRLADELRNRPERPVGGDLPAIAGDGAGVYRSTGKGLYREDGGFLVGEAADTAVLQAGLKTCYAQYDDARAKLEAVKQHKE